MKWQIATPVGFHKGYCCEGTTPKAPSHMDKPWKKTSDTIRQTRPLYLDWDCPSHPAWPLIYRYRMDINFYYYIALFKYMIIQMVELQISVFTWLRLIIWFTEVKYISNCIIVDSTAVQQQSTKIPQVYNKWYYFTVNSSEVFNQAAFGPEWKLDIWPKGKQRPAIEGKKKKKLVECFSLVPCHLCYLHKPDYTSGILWCSSVMRHENNFSGCSSPIDSWLCHPESLAVSGPGEH